MIIRIVRNAWLYQASASVGISTIKPACRSFGVKGFRASKSRVRTSHSSHLRRCRRLNTSVAAGSFQLVSRVRRITFM